MAAGPPRVYTVTFDGGNMLKRAWPLMTTTSSLLQGAHIVTAIVTESVTGVSATGLGSAVGKVLLRTDNGAQYYNTGTALAPVWTPLAPVSTTSSTAELNFNDGPTAGVATASKTAVLGADKELDEFHTAALYLGAAAGTLVTATAAEINKKVAAAGHGGRRAGRMGVARFTFDPSATAGDRTRGGAWHGRDAAAVCGSDRRLLRGQYRVHLGSGHGDHRDPRAGRERYPDGDGRERRAVLDDRPQGDHAEEQHAGSDRHQVHGGARDHGHRWHAGLDGGKLTGFLHYVVSAATA